MPLPVTYAGYQEDFSLLRNQLDRDLGAIKWVARLLGGDPRAQHIDEARERLTLRCLHPNSREEGLSAEQMGELARVALTTVHFDRAHTLYVKKLTYDAKCPRGMLWIGRETMEHMDFEPPTWGEMKQGATIMNVYFKVAEWCPPLAAFLAPACPPWMKEGLVGVEEG